MARRGNTKVKTGCRTCKIRKVKCDEARPDCNRCVTTGRRCDGYSPPPRGHYSWQQLLMGTPSSAMTWPASVGRDELRSLDFFRHSVAPMLCFTLDTSFWTQRVPQILAREPAARHAVSAISALYEHFRGSVGTTRHPSPCNSHNGDERSKIGRAFALRHYNHAIKEVFLRENTRDDLDGLLVVSLLFACIEFLQGNALAAIQHCRHGVLLCASSEPSSEISELFAHLSIFPLFFGASSTDLPCLPGEDTLQYSVCTVNEARRILDRLLTRTARLVRSSAEYRISLGSSQDELTLFDPALEMLQRQREQLISELESWMDAFNRLKRLAPTSGGANGTALRLLEMQCLVCSIWAGACLASDEEAYDAYLAQFTRIVDIANAEKRAMSRKRTRQRPEFTFEMGFAPLLHMMVLKCRCLHLRLEGLALMKAISSTRECLWDTEVMYAINLRFIEMEHGCAFGSQGTPEPASATRMLPSNEFRIYDSTHGNPEEFMDASGSASLRVMVSYFRHDLEGRTVPGWTWVNLVSPVS